MISFESIGLVNIVPLLRFNLSWRCLLEVGGRIRAEIKRY